MGLEFFRNSFTLVNDDKIESIEEIIQVLVYMISQEDQKKSNITLKIMEDKQEDETEVITIDDDSDDDAEVRLKESVPKLRLKSQDKLFANPALIHHAENI